MLDAALPRLQPSSATTTTVNLLAQACCSHKAAALVQEQERSTGTNQGGCSVLTHPLSTTTCHHTKLM